MRLRLIRKSPLLSMAVSTSIGYNAPTNLNYFYSFGIFGLLTLGIQFLTGIFLSFHYIPEISYAFLSVEHIMRDVNYGCYSVIYILMEHPFFLYVFIFI